MKIIRWIVGFAFAVLAIAFAITNRQDVSVNWSPFHTPVEGPLYLLVLSLMAIGFLTGGLIVWINTIPLRRKSRQMKKRIQALEKELEAATAAPAQEAPRSYFSSSPENANQNNAAQPALNYYKG
jgi:uncharacterized integral membrane protein